MNAECVLYESGEQLQHVYFPTSSIVSLRCELQEGSGLEIAVAGNESMIGIAIIMGGQSRTNRAVVCSTGYALRIKARALMLEFERGGALQNSLLRYMQALITQTGQTTVCNRHHALDQQLCRWLLLRLDRLSSNVLPMTQERIAAMLGVRRESVTEAAGKLQQAGLIRHSRGRITVLDRPGLEAKVCECHAVVSLEYDRLLAQIAPARH